MNYINQIENKDYDLNEIMYQRMKRHILKSWINNKEYGCYDLNHYNTGVHLNKSNLNDRIYKDAILNYHNGYREVLLRQTLLKQKENFICGLNPFQKWLDFQNSINYVDIKLVENILNSYRQEQHGVCSYTYYIKELYKIWVKL